MDLENAARQSGVIPPENVAPLLSRLSEAPDFNWLLTQPHKTQARLQGDLLDDFPLALVGPDGSPRCKRFTVLVLNNTCDLQPLRSEFVTVAPVFSFSDFSRFIREKRGENRAANYLADVKRNKVFELLWLPPFGPFSSGAVVYLDRIGAVASSIYESAIAASKRFASFSQSGFYFLLIKLTKHLARPESEEVLRHS